ncbi:MAG: hypothetical protein Q7T86_10210 [Hyphomicrobiaceae bacterium]|nr:hypothetical protein [Hyphomicrobiaceae bacterium]
MSMSVVAQCNSDRLRLLQIEDHRIFHIEEVHADAPYGSTIAVRQPRTNLGLSAFHIGLKTFKEVDLGGATASSMRRHTIE